MIGQVERWGFVLADSVTQLTERLETACHMTHGSRSRLMFGAR